MLLGAKQSLWKKYLNNQLFVDPSQCNEYLMHSSESDTAIIRINQFINNGNGGPYTAQLIIKSLQTGSVDRKFLAVHDTNITEALFMHVIGSGWRFKVSSDINNLDKSITFAASNGQHGSGLGHIQVTSEKMNFISDSQSHQVTVNNTLIEDYPTINIQKNLPYYWVGHQPVDNIKNQISQIEIMGVYNNDWGNMYAKFYHFRLFDKDMNMICDLWPKQQDNQAGILDKCTNIFWTKTHLNGSFILGTD